ncbi:hypothetical protein CQW23_14447 [Capsicum baccatum]|uniref:Ubiquitin-like protease family profile domain-containing protein n=1 Tax=Capsicum baccatum TaxID=33114 RepID=A0A2G2WJE0_CAPBA|nr:hypothetical protein CQW23_14447 [Capsicum baccatum]
MNIVKNVMAVYSLDDPTLNEGGREYHLNEYINGFRRHATVSWNTVDNIFIPINLKDKNYWVLAVLSFSERCIFIYDSYSTSDHDVVVLAEIEKLAEIIILCLHVCNFYKNKGIDLDSHPRYKDKDMQDLINVCFVEDLSQQQSESVDCRLYMVTYAEYLSYGEGVPSVEFNPVYFVQDIFHYCHKFLDNNRIIHNLSTFVEAGLLRTNSVRKVLFKMVRDNLFNDFISSVTLADGSKILQLICTGKLGDKA